jgi:hypothetical protein
MGEMTKHSERLIIQRAEKRGRMKWRRERLN